MDDRLIKIQIITKEFIDHLNQDIHVNIKNDFQFYQSLVNHLQSTFQDIQMSMDIDKNLLRKVIEKNPQTVKAIQRNIGPLEKVAGRTISNEEIAYITIHVQAAIERSKEYANSISVLLVSNTGLGEVTLLVSKLKKFFNFNVLDVIPQHALAGYDLTGIDLILTTVPIQAKRCESLLVSPDLTDEECIILGEKVEQAKVRKTNSDVDQQFRKLEIQIAKDISECPLDKEIIYKNIITTLRRFMYPDTYQNIRNILTYLLKDHIAVDVEAQDWKDAIQKSAQGLLEEGYINELYIEEMIENIEKMGRISFWQKVWRFPMLPLM